MERSSTAEGLEQDGQGNREQHLLTVSNSRPRTCGCGDPTATLGLRWSGADVGSPLPYRSVPNPSPSGWVLRSGGVINRSGWSLRLWRGGGGCSCD